MKNNTLLFTLFILIISICLNACKEKPKYEKQAEIDKVVEELVQKVDGEEEIGSDTVETETLYKTWDVREQGFAFTVEELEYIEFDEKQKIEKITDYPTVKNILKGIVVFNDADYSSSGNSDDIIGVKEIHFRNGEKLMNLPDDIGFVAYYPSEDVILFVTPDGVIDVAYNLSDARETETVGNPAYMVTSEDKQFRLNGYMQSNDCVTYFIEKKADGNYKKVIPLSDVFDKKEEFELCQIKNAFWANRNETLYIEEKFISEPSNYYRITIKDSGTDEEQVQFYTSGFKPNQKIKLGEVYSDTVNYISFDDNYDDWYFTVKKANIKADLIFNQEFENTLVNGDEIIINWRMDSMRNAGDPEVLYFVEYLTSFEKIETTSSSSENEEKHSFEVSCGSGCAMTYTEEKIEIHNSIKEVTFKVNMFVNDRLMDVYLETYNYACDTLTNSAQISLKGGSTYSFDSQSLDVQNMLKSYLSQLCD